VNSEQSDALSAPPSTLDPDQLQHSELVSDDGRPRNVDVEDLISEAAGTGTASPVSAGNRGNRLRSLCVLSCSKTHAKQRNGRCQTSPAVRYLLP